MARNDKQMNEDIAAKLKAMHSRAGQQPISYKPLFDEAADLAEDQFKRAMAAEAELHTIDAEIERLRAGLDAAVRAANLALFVINKAGVMPNSSWEGGFKKDMATAEAARVHQQSEQPAQED